MYSFIFLVFNLYYNTIFLLWKLMHKTMPTGNVFASSGCFWASQYSLCFSPEVVNNLFLHWSFVKFCGDAWLASNLHCSSNLGSFTSFLAACDNFSSKQLHDVTLASWESKCYLENMDVRNQARFHDKKIMRMNIIPLISAAIWITRNVTKGMHNETFNWRLFFLNKSLFFVLPNDLKSIKFSSTRLFVVR